MSGIKIPQTKPEIIDTLTASVSSAEAAIDAITNLSLPFQKTVDWLFWTCVEILKVWGDATGLGYNLINILIFILLQPALILLFFTLWIYEKNKRKGVHYG